MLNAAEAALKHLLPYLKGRKTVRVGARHMGYYGLFSPLLSRHVMNKVMLLVALEGCSELRSLQSFHRAARSFPGLQVT